MPTTTVADDTSIHWYSSFSGMDDNQSLKNDIANSALRQKLAARSEDDFEYSLLALAGVPLAIVAVIALLWAYVRVAEQ